MFKRATKYFTELSNSAEYKNGTKSFSGGVLCIEAQAICHHENVWTWSPSDVEELTIVRMPQQPLQRDEAAPQEIQVASQGPRVARTRR